MNEINDQFAIQLSFKGKKTLLSNVTTGTTIRELHDIARSALVLDDTTALKLIHRGKVLKESTSSHRPSCNCHPSNSPPDKNATVSSLFAASSKKSKSPPQVIAMATTQQSRSEVTNRRSDPTIRGFDQEKQREEATSSATATAPWGPSHRTQSPNYKFCKIQACTWQSFGHRASSSRKTPHAFEAVRLLEKLATDPGIVAVMEERELVVMTLAEMDPIDDRLAQKKKAQSPGSCLLGYNTNHGLRIDLKLRTDDLEGFLPYSSIAATLLHELSHNWVGEHDALFWSNYGQMRVEYLYTHAQLSATGYVIKGRTSAALADVEVYCGGGKGGKEVSMRSIYVMVVRDLKGECASHGIPVEMVAPAVLHRCKEIEEKAATDGGGRGRMVGGNNPDSLDGSGNRSPRELALAAAERRAREQSQQQNEER